ncbi:MAG: ABC transporter [Ruminococcaceae bacterium]|nr:ABC transporter [Oscillospiraceae bacterium]
MSAIYRKELRSYFTGMTGAVFMGFILLVAGIFMSIYVFDGLLAQFQAPLSAMGFIYLLAIPVLTMRSMAEEKGQKIDQFLYTLPINVSKIVMAKYFAMITVLAIPLAILGIIPVIMSLYGSVHFTVAYSSLLVIFLLGCALVAIGMFLSSLTESQVIAAVLAIITFILLYFVNAIVGIIPENAYVSLGIFCALALIAGLILYYLTKNVVVGVSTGVVLAGITVGLFLWKNTMFEGAFAKVMSVFDVFGRAYNFYDGMFDLTAVVYYLSIVVMFVFFTVQSMEKKRWSEVD